MEIRLSRKEFLDLLVSGSVFAGRNKVVSMFDNVRLMIGGSGITIWSMDGDCSIERSMDLKDFAGEIDFCVNPVGLIKLLRLVKDDYVALDISDKLLVVRHSSGQMEFPLESSVDFPRMAKSGGDTSYEVLSEVLFGWVQMSKNFVSVDSLRPIMCGMYLGFSGGKVTMCATDTRVLLTDSYLDRDIVGDVSAVIPTSVFGALLDLLNGTDRVKVRIGSTNVAFKAGGSLLVCKVQNGKYPAFDRVIPTGNDTSASIDKATLTDSVHRAMLSADKATQLLRMSLRGVEFGIVGEDLAFGRKSQETCMCSHTGVDLEIGVQGDFLLKCLGAVGSADVELTFSTPSSPILIYDKESLDKRILLMPMLLPS